MEESAFEFNSAHVAETSRRFPAVRLVVTASQPVSDIDYLTATRGGEFGRHAWDESGHL